jgi:hypothetical protein
VLKRLASAATFRASVAVANTVTLLSESIANAFMCDLLRRRFVDAIRGTITLITPVGIESKCIVYAPTVRCDVASEPSVHKPYSAQARSCEVVLDVANASYTTFSFLQHQ